MKRAAFSGRLAAGVLALALAAAAGAQQRADVPYVPTPPSVVEAMLDVAGVGADDYLIDLGSGDGRIVLTAVTKRGARATGVELNPGLVADARREAGRLGATAKANFVDANIYIFDFSPATVLTMYLLPSINLDLRPRILSLKPGTRVVSHDFDMGKWRPDVRREISVPNKPYGPPVSQIYLWHVPAHLAGKWEWSFAAGRVEASFRQTFQQVAADAVLERGRVAIENVRLQGDTLAFSLASDAGGRRQTWEFSGRISGDRIAGSYREGAGAQQQEWQARRVARGEMSIE
jgi:SAM-dependent methyltransferase